MFFYRLKMFTATIIIFTILVLGLNQVSRSVGILTGRAEPPVMAISLHGDELRVAALGAGYAWPWPRGLQLPVKLNNYRRQLLGYFNQGLIYVREKIIAVYYP